MKKRVLRCGTLLVGMALVLGLFAYERVFLADAFDIEKMMASVDILNKAASTEEKEPTSFLEVDMSVTKASVAKTPMEIYDGMTIAEKEAALQAGTLHLEYSGWYTQSPDKLSLSKGAQYYNGHKETYYSEKVLPGTSLNIPGRHVAEDGTIRDGDGYICVATDQSFMPKGSILITSLGPAKVYDSGCAYGVVDIYVSW